MKIKLLAFTIVFSLNYSCNETSTSQGNYKYNYETVDNDITNTLIYTLDNGLKIYMSINKDEPRIQTNIAVNSGSKQDPSDATGLAHYLEHMVFKGTSKIATINWEKEKVILSEISNLYEKRRSISDKDERKAIYRKIDSLSGLAAQYAVPNEYDKMISSIGAKGTNAYTSSERTVYINEIPSNEFEKWLSIEAERFSELVLRLFHTELEAVYEEYNRGKDNDYRLANETMSSKLFKKHTYGTQTTIGTGEHLRNPSMEKIHQYFNDWYVPNNMAIILSGDINPDVTVDLIKQYFGTFEYKDVPIFEAAVEDEINEPEYVSVTGTNTAWVNIGYRLPGIKSEDIYMMDLFDGLLNNGQAGLIDLNLIKGQKVLEAYCYGEVMKDYSVFELQGVPRIGQSLDEVKDLLLAEVEKIKSGDFEDWLLKAVIKNFKLREQEGLLYNRVRAGIMTNAFILGQQWSNVVNMKEKLNEVSKQDIIDFANKYFKNNYVVVYKENGERNNPKIEKPKITQIKLNRDTSSLFAKNFYSNVSSRLIPIFDDFKKEIINDSLESGVKLFHVKNKSNETFSLNYILEMGAFSDREMALAVEYIKYLGTDKYSANALQLELFKLGLNYNVYAAQERVYVTLSGLDESIEEGIQLFEHILANVQADTAALKNTILDKLKERDDTKLSKRSILYGGLLNYGKYGKDSPIKHYLNKEELNNLDPNDLVAKIKNLTSFHHYIYYYGRKEVNEIKSILNKYHLTPNELQSIKQAKKFKELSMDSNKVYFVNYDMVQSELMMLSKAGQYDENLLATSKVFNEYFGSGLSSIIFQEIRESKALAYSAYSVFTIPNKLDKSHYVRAYVGTQVDKLEDAKVAMIDLMNNMPEVENQFQSAKIAALKKIETSRTKRASLFWKYLSSNQMGRNYDINKKIYNEIKNLELQDIKEFFNTKIKGNKYTYLVIGNRDLVDMEVLEKMGELKELSLEEIFGY